MLMDSVTLESSVAKHKVGQVASFNDGNEYIYVKAGEAITQYAVCLIDESYNIVMATDTLSAPGAGQGKLVCIPQIALTNAYYGWALICGTGKALGAASCAKFTQLTTSATSGVVDDATTTGLEVVDGLVFSATLTGAAATACVVSYPVVGRTLA